MKTINGQKLKLLLLSAANNLYNHYPEIDALNVFPVPDGDTGMNMNLTMTSGSKEIQNRNDTNCSEIAKTFSRGLLMGARGNSGVITSQIFRGFSSSLVNKEEIDALDLANAFDNGRQIAYKAVVKPVEGTILTVIRESSSALLNKVNSKTSVEEALKILLDEAKASLNRTPNLLPVLKEVGVVDSGGAGLVKIIEGMYKASINKFVERNEPSALTEKVGSSSDNDILKKNIYAYSCEFKIKLGPVDSKKQFSKQRFMSVMSSHGENIEIDDTKQGLLIVKCSTNVPGTIISYCQNFGEFINIDVKNVSPEIKEEATENEINVSVNLPKKDYAMIATSSGKGIDELFHEIGVDYIVSGGQTMNPSTEDFLKLIKEANAKTCYVFPNNGNIIMAANQAKDVLAGEVDVQVIPTKTIMQGVVSSMMFNPDMDAKTNLNEMISAIKNVKSGAVTFSIKDTDINGVKVFKDQFMAIRESKDILSCHKEKIDALKDLLKGMIDEDSGLVTILFGQDINKEEEETVIKYMEETYPDIDSDIRRGDQPVYSFLVGIE